MSKIHFWSPGDMSVGIPGCGTEIDLCYDIEFSDTTTRAQIAQSFVDIFKDLWDSSKVHYAYDDECAMCGSELKEENNYKCIDLKCPCNE